MCRWVEIEVCGTGARAATDHPRLAVTTKSIRLNIWPRLPHVFRSMSDREGCPEGGVACGHVLRAQNKSRTKRRSVITAVPRRPLIAGKPRASAPRKKPSWPERGDWIRCCLARDVKEWRQVFRADSALLVRPTGREVSMSEGSRDAGRSAPKAVVVLRRDVCERSRGQTRHRIPSIAARAGRAAGIGTWCRSLPRSDYRGRS